MIYKLWYSFFKNIYYFAPLIGLVNIFLFLYVSSSFTLTDNASYVQSVFDSSLCLAQSSLCSRLAFHFNSYIAQLFSFSSPSFWFYSVQYITYIPCLLLVLFLIRKIFKENLFVSSPFRIFRYLLLLPSFIYVFQPGKETFQFISLCILLYSFYFLVKRNFSLSLIFFFFSACIASGSHELFAVPVVFSYLIVICLYFCVFTSMNRIRFFTSPLSLLTFIALFIAISSFAIFKIPAVASQIQFYDSYSLADINLSTTTSYLRLSPQNPFYFLLGFLQFTFLPLPTIGSFSLFLFSFVFFIELIFVLFSFYSFFRSSRLQFYSFSRIEQCNALFLASCLIITFLLVFSYWSLGTLNWGTALRHKAPLFCLFHVIHFRYFQTLRHTQSLK